MRFPLLILLVSCVSIVGCSKPQLRDAAFIIGSVVYEEEKFQRCYPQKRGLAGDPANPDPYHSEAACEERYSFNDRSEVEAAQAQK